jgi:hypothetical protein
VEDRPVGVLAHGGGDLTLERSDLVGEHFECCD